MKIKYAIILLIVFSPLLMYAQDSIEYCLGEQIFDYKISDNEYFFKTFDGKPVENDKLIFNSNIYFKNFEPTPYRIEYEDSIYFILVSRRLKKFYNETTLFDQNRPFIRMIVLKPEHPFVFKCFYSSEKLNFSLKISDGTYVSHGTLIIDTVCDVKSLKSLALKNFSFDDFMQLKNDPVGIGNVIYPIDFIFEIFDGKRYNIVIVNQANIRKKQYRKLLAVYKKVDKYIKKQNYPLN
jgi:hypothetical protein